MLREDHLRVDITNRREYGSRNYKPGAQETQELRGWPHRCIGKGDTTVMARMEVAFRGRGSRGEESQSRLEEGWAIEVRKVRRSLPGRGVGRSCIPACRRSSQLESWHHHGTFGRENPTRTFFPGVAEEKNGSSVQIPI